MVNLVAKSKYQIVYQIISSKITIAKFNSDRFSQLRELIDKEMGLKEFMVIDEKGVDISSMHQDEIVNTEPKKNSFVSTRHY